ncbi:hypothetical protein ACLOJK_012936 [Asimina triloba]
MFSNLQKKLLLSGIEKGLGGEVTGRGLRILLVFSYAILTLVAMMVGASIAVAWSFLGVDLSFDLGVGSCCGRSGVVDRLDEKAILFCSPLFRLSGDVTGNDFIQPANALRGVESRGNKPKDCLDTEYGSKTRNTTLLKRAVKWIDRLENTREPRESRGSDRRMEGPGLLSFRHRDDFRTCQIGTKVSFVGDENYHQRNGKLQLRSG